MYFDALEERLSSYGSGGYYFLEAFILKLLELEGEPLGQKIVQHGGGAAPFDATAPDGIGEIREPLAIEITFTISGKKLQAIIANYSRRASPGYRLLVIAPKVKEDQLPLIFGAMGGASQFPLFFWGKEKINELILKHADAAGVLAENMFSVRLKMAAARPTNAWQEEREQIIKEISEQYRAGSFSLALGAGVSSSAGLPDWNTLLNSLFVSMLSEENIGEGESNNSQVAQIVSRLMEVDGPSALMLARYIRKGLAAGSPTEQQVFIEAITKQLYELRNTDYPIESMLITAIATLCTPTRTGAKIKSILTYNFDDFIERALKAKSLVHKSVFEEFETASAEELPIYHVHGFLPQDRSGYPNLDRCTLVFSEEGYHQIYRDAYHWSNLAQLNIFKETSCLMIGLSLTDPNLRRLLEIASKSLEKPKHFAFMRRLNPVKFKRGEGGAPLKIPNAVIERFLDRHHSTNEELMRELGVTIIWYEDYNDIPVILDRVRVGQRSG
ncbi:SIR2 family protein [Pseudomonas asiatica]|uniref:SIR2 family protein n=1 Tax=Pseudomonas TaxID=286 RepID=UPI001046B9DF|nr:MULTISPECIES: SIR2 family protein [Pseudomonas]MCO8260182.1 SIR2 family protein [Pseudomonas asiatica]TCP75875.1 SIR2-like protein [Pseudomonas putida]